MRLQLNGVGRQKVNVHFVGRFGKNLCCKRSFVPQTNQHQEEFEVSQLSQLESTL